MKSSTTLKTSTTENPIPYRFIKIVVNKNELMVTHSNNQVFPIMDTAVMVHSYNEIDFSYVKLHEISHATTGLFTSVDETYMLEFFFNKTKATTKLSPEMSFNLMNFFKFYKPYFNNDYNTGNDYCCINFAYEMAYGRGQIMNENNTKYFNELLKSFDELPVEEFSEEKLKPGDMIRISNTKTEDYHYAISVGQYYYLSLLGRNSAPLAISTLEAIKTGYEADKCVQVIKKKL